MGQAKNRGTFEERKAAAPPKKKRMSAAERDARVRLATRMVLEKIFRGMATGLPIFMKGYDE